MQDVIQDYVNLRRRGVNMIGLCPFHNEKTPSFTVSPSKNIYKCFGCGKGGSPVQFMMDHEKLSFPESIRFLAKKYGIELEESEVSESYKQEQLVNESLFLINEYANSFFQKQLWETDLGKSIGLSYFKARGFLETTIKSFELGFTPKENGDLYGSLIKAKYNEEHIFKLGLSKTANSDFFRARVMFPIHNLSGKVIGFGGRTLSQNKKVPKYLNSPESEIYNKRKSLYGLYQAKNGIRNQDECILVEGYTDTISLHQSGITNVVASSGTSLTVDQIKLIKRYTDNVKVLYDGDLAGIKAAMRGLNLILEQNMNIKMVLLPDGEDPDSYLGKLGQTAFIEFLDTQAKDFLLFKVDLINKEAQNDPIRKTALIKDILESIAKIPDTLKRASYIKQCSKLLEIQEDILIKESNKIISAEIRRKQISKEREDLTIQNQAYFPQEDQDETEWKPKKVESLSFQEHDLARIALEHGIKIYEEEESVTVIEFLFHNLSIYLDSFEKPIYSKIIKLVHESFETNQAIELGDFTNHSDGEVSQMAVNLLSSQYSFANWDERGSGLMTQKSPENNQIIDVDKALFRYLLKRLKLKEKEYKLKIKDLQEVGGKDEEILQIVQIFQKLQQEKKALASKIETNLTYKI